MYDIIAFGRKKESELSKINNITMVTGNFSNIDDFRDLLVDVSCVIHLISTTVPNDDTSCIPKEIEENVIPTVKLLEDIIRCGTPKIIFASSAGTVYGETGEAVNDIYSALNPYCSYGVQKGIIEAYLRFYGVKYGLDYRIVRISNPYGVGQRKEKKQGLIPILVNHLIHDEPITIYGSGNSMRDYIFMPDLIDGIAKVIDYKGQQRLFNLGYGRYYSVLDVIQIIEKIVGKNFPDKNMVENRFCDIERSYVDMSQSHWELGWFPKTDLREGIQSIFQEIL